MRGRAYQTPDTADPVNPSPWSLAAPHLPFGRHVLPRRTYVSSLYQIASKYSRYST